MLKYNPKMGYLTGVPTRDLTDEDIKEVEAKAGIKEKDLIASGVYTKIKERKVK